MTINKASALLLIFLSLATNINSSTFESNPTYGQRLIRLEGEINGTSVSNVQNEGHKFKQSGDEGNVIHLSNKKSGGGGGRGGRGIGGRGIGAGGASDANHHTSTKKNAVAMRSKPLIYVVILCLVSSYIVSVLAL